MKEKDKFLKYLNSEIERYERLGRRWNYYICTKKIRDVYKKIKAIER